MLPSRIKPTFQTLFSLLVFAALPSIIQAADHPWQITSQDGKSWIDFGFLAQGQAEWFTSPLTKTTTQNLFLRRIRLIAGGQINDKLSFFIDSDSPNLGKGQADGTKVAGNVYLQDVIFTYKFRTEFQLDGGLLLVPVSHNGAQGATSLLPVDYGPYSFLASDPTDSRVGRDYGLQARGYLFNKHIEYRAGAYQGRRNPNANDSFRYTGRLVWYLFGSDTNFFYTGTTLGTKQILALGTSFDNQANYHAQTVDLFYDQPLFKGDGLTVQADLTHYDGGTTFLQLPPQNAWMSEAGYYFHHVKVGPFMQLSGEHFTQVTGKNQSKYLGGLAWWPEGHRLNVKLGVGQTKTSSDPRRIQAVIQTQFYIY